MLQMLGYTNANRLVRRNQTLNTYSNTQVPATFLRQEVWSRQEVRKTDDLRGENQSTNGPVSCCLGSAWLKLYTHTHTSSPTHDHHVFSKVFLYTFTCYWHPGGRYIYSFSDKFLKVSRMLANMHFCQRQTRGGNGGTSVLPTSLDRWGPTRHGRKLVLPTSPGTSGTGDGWNMFLNSLIFKTNRTHRGKSLELFWVILDEFLVLLVPCSSSWNQTNASLQIIQIASNRFHSSFFKIRLYATSKAWFFCHSWPAVTPPRGCH